MKLVSKIVSSLSTQVRMIEKDRITEKKLPTNAQVVDFLQQKLQASSKQWVVVPSWKCISQEVLCYFTVDS